MTSMPPMDCHSAREGLWPPERPRLDGDAEIAARAHVRGCPDCTRYFLQDRRLLESLDALRRRRAPLAVRDRVVAALASARTRDRMAEVSATSEGTAKVRSTPWTRRRVWAGALVGIPAAAVLALQPMSPTESPESAFAEDYLRRAVAADHLVTSDPAEVTRFLTRELGFHVAPLTAEGLRVERVEICLLDGQRGAMIVYRLDGREISHYVMPRAGARPRPVRVAEDGAHEMGLPVVTWATTEAEQALVGEASTDELLGIARTAPAASRLTAGR